MEPEPFAVRRTSASSIISLICGILGCIPFVTGLTAVVLGIVGIRQTRDPRVSGRGMAIAGLVLGVISLAGWIFFSGSIAVGYFALKIYSEPARVAGENFTRAVSEGKIDEARGLAVDSFDRPSLEALAERFKPWGTFEGLSMSSISIDEKNADVSITLGGTATFRSQSQPYSMTLKKVGERYQVQKFDFR